MAVKPARQIAAAKAVSTPKLGHVRITNKQVISAPKIGAPAPVILPPGPTIGAQVMAKAGAQVVKQLDAAERAAKAAIKAKIFGKVPSWDDVFTKVLNKQKPGRSESDLFPAPSESLLGRSSSAPFTSPFSGSTSTSWAPSGATSSQDCRPARPLTQDQKDRRNRKRKANKRKLEKCGC